MLKISGDLEIGLGQPELLRRVNAWRVLRLLRLKGPCSRADLVRYSGLSAPTISGVVSYLQKKGLVEPLGRGNSGGGRPPYLLRFNSGYGYVIGVDVGTSLFRFNVSDLNGTVFVKWTEPTHSQSTPRNISALVRKCLKRLECETKISHKKVLALTASVPGMTNATTGVVFSAPILPMGWHQVPLGTILQNETGIPTQVENDVNLAAIAEHWCGSAQDAKDFAFLSIGTGVGAGIFVNGRLHHGSEWAAGEIGYLRLPGTRETPLVIYQKGSLEGLIGAKGIEHSWRNLQHKNGRANGNRPLRLSADKILDMAGQGNTDATRILHRMAHNLANAVENICVILNPSLVIFGGRIGSHQALFDATRTILKRNDFCRPKLALGLLGREAPVLGAVWQALRSAMERILPLAPEKFPPEEIESRAFGALITGLEREGASASQSSKGRREIR